MQPLPQVSYATVEAWKWYCASISPPDVVVLRSPCTKTNRLPAGAAAPILRKWGQNKHNRNKRMTANFIQLFIRNAMLSEISGGRRWFAEERRGRGGGRRPRWNGSCETEHVRRGLRPPEPGRRRFTVSSWTERSDGWYQNVTDRERNSTSSPTFGA